MWQVFVLYEIDKIVNINNYYNIDSLIQLHDILYFMQVLYKLLNNGNNNYYIDH